MTGTGVDVVWRVLRLLVVLVWALPVPARSEPQLQFTSPTEFQVHPDQRLYSRGVGLQYDDAGKKERYFARLTARQATDGTLAFAAEGQAGQESTYCYGSACGAVAVGVLSGAEGGLLYLGVDVGDRSGGRIRSRFEDFPPQRVEVSVQAGRQKVYQEVRVTAPADAPDCSDYREMNEDRYRCYFTREIIAPAFRVANSPLVAELPGQLLQDREEYALVFAEEFTGTYTSFDTDTHPDNCDRGLAELDPSKWNYRQKICRSDPQGPPCEYLESGHLHISVTRQCDPEIRTRGVSSPGMAMWKCGTPSASPPRVGRRTITTICSWAIWIGRSNICSAPTTCPWTVWSGCSRWCPGSRSIYLSTIQHRGTSSRTSTETGGERIANMTRCDRYGRIRLGITVLAPGSVVVRGG